MKHEFIHLILDRMQWCLCANAWSHTQRIIVFRQLLIIIPIYHTDILTFSSVWCVLMLDSDRIRDRMLLGVCIFSHIYSKPYPHHPLSCSVLLYHFLSTLFEFLHDEVVVVAGSFVHWTIAIPEEENEHELLWPFNKKWAETIKSQRNVKKRSGERERARERNTHEGKINGIINVGDSPISDVMFDITLGWTAHTIHGSSM